MQKRKRQLTGFFLFFSSFLIAASFSPVLAFNHRTPYPDNRVPERNLTVHQADLEREKITAQVATRQAELRTRAVESIKKAFSRILDRYEAALKRLDNILNRIEARIGKFEAKGVDMSAARAKLNSAKEKQALALAAIKNAKDRINAIDTSSDVKTAVLEAKGAVRSAKIVLQDYHFALKEIVKEIKASSELRTATGSAR